MALKNVLIGFVLAVLASSCVTYVKCVEKFGTLQDSTKLNIDVPIDTTLQAIVPEDSLDGFINLDTLCEAWREGVLFMFNDSLKAVSQSGKLSTQHWIDKYNRLLRYKSKTIRDTVYVPYKDTVRVVADCPPVVVFDPLDKLPWYAPRKLWETFKLFAAWVLIGAGIIAIIYNKFKDNNVKLYVEKNNTEDHKPTL